jgi:anthranilate phosphoribosyltransferase
MIKEAIAKLAKRENLSEKEAADTMSEIMAGEATDSQIAAFITALRMKGETVDEITGCARIMRTFATPINVHSNVDIDREDICIDRETILDTCGTGGDGTGTFNVSTASAFVVAGCGLVVAKHGNRSVSSACGSADVLEQLGVNINCPAAKVEDCLKTLGIGFLYAPLMHGAMKYAIGPRKQIGIRTVFNILGPLTNPARATSQVLGVYSASLTENMAGVLKNLGSRRAWVVYGMDGLDELSICASTQVTELVKGAIKTFVVTPEQYGLKRSGIETIKGGNAQENAVIIQSILGGQLGPRRDIVLLNAGAALFVGEKASSVEDGIKLAADAIDSGRAKDKLNKLIFLTNQE